ncbi:MAG: BatA domain-containing protein [Planctomycetota bacterium]
MLNPSLVLVSFVAPWMAWGAAAAIGLPLLAHLLSRTRYRQAVFPAARLVRQAVAATSRIETPRHRLLMLLRWLVLGLLVLAFMRPQWTPKAQAVDTENGIALILLIDASASMQRIDKSVSLYDRAIREAGELINQLDPARDVAAVVRIDHSPSALLPKATAQFGLLTDQLNATEPGYSHADWQSALAVVQRLTRDEQRAIRVITVSDQQGEAPDFEQWLSNNPSAQVDHVRIDGPNKNVALRVADVRPYPAVDGEPLTVTYELQSYSDTPTQLTIVIPTNEDNDIEQSLTLGPGETRRVSFDVPTSGLVNQYIDARIEIGDAIHADDQAGVLAPKIEAGQVLIIHDTGPFAARLAQRVALLLNPGQIDGIALPDVETISLDQSERALSQLEPGRTRAVVLLNQKPLPDQSSQRLEAYAQAGGGIIQFVMEGIGGSPRSTTAAAIDFELEPLRIFDGPARAGLANLAWPGVSNSAIDARATPILMDELERVIVAELPRGRGRLIAINTTLSPEPGGLLAKPAFVVLFNELYRYASPGLALPPPTHPGDPFPADLRQAIRKEGQLYNAGVDIERDVFQSLGWHIGDHRASTPPPVFVTLNPTESDTRPTDTWSPTQALDSTTTTSNARTGTTPLRHSPIELWPYLVLGMLGLVAAESLLLGRFAGSNLSNRQGAGT